MIDLHCDTLMFCALHEDYSLRDARCAVSIDKLQKGGVMAQCFAIFVLSGKEAELEGWKGSPYEYYLCALAAYKRELENNASVLRPALSAADLLKNRDEGFISSILTVEDAVALEGKIERLEELHRDGVRMMSLCWNFENELCYPNSRDERIMARGLKDFGIECVSGMNELGIAIDVSHLSEGGFWDVVRHSKKPFAASHSCAAAVRKHPRNLSDGQLRALSDSGGIVGVNFFPAFLHEKSDGSLEHIVRHILHIYRCAGLDVLALGSDFDGFEAPCHICSSDKLPLLRRELEKHFTQDMLDKICHGNAIRFFRDVIGN